MKLVLEVQKCTKEILPLAESAGGEHTQISLTRFFKSKPRAEMFGSRPHSTNGTSTEGMTFLQPRKLGELCAPPNYKSPRPA